jgi:cytochrome c5
MFCLKISRFFLLLLTVACVVAAIAYADNGQGGKLLYRANCKVCHDKGSPNGQYSPMTLTQDQWRRFFSSKLIPAHKAAVEPKSGKKLLEVLSPPQFKAIQRFCIDHAADSEQPATCG